MTDITPGPANPHPPTEACWDNHCSFHNVDEPSDGAYRICVECGHVYLTAEDLRAAFMAEVMPCLVSASAPSSAPPPAEDIWSCPFCAHDF